jgi:nucleotide-binding universal stress UspA family protein
MERFAPKIVAAAVDGSQRALAAAKVAAAIARQNGARLLVVTVVRPPEGWWGIAGGPPPAPNLGDALADAQKQVLDAAVASLDLAGVSHEELEEVGDPAAQILALCEREGVDLLVIGKRGAGLVERIMLGSVADRIVHSAVCPVLVVP